MKTWIIAELTFREAWRRRIVWAALLLGLAFLILYGVGYRLIFQEVSRHLPASDTQQRVMLQSFTDPFTVAGLYVVNFLVALMAVLTSVDTLSGEISSGAVQSVVSKPLARWEVVLGKWLGFAGMLALYLVYMAGGVLVIAALIAQYTPPHILEGLTLMWLQSLVLVTVTLLGGTALSTLANGVLAFGLFGIGFIGSFIEQIGASPMLRSEVAVRVGIAASLIMPATSLWNRASSLMSGSLISQLGVTPFNPGSTPSSQMVLYGIAYLLICLQAAVWRFQRRDL